jgi:hypothetical protein
VARDERLPAFSSPDGRGATTKRADKTAEAGQTKSLANFEGKLSGHT